MNTKKIDMKVKAVAHNVVIFEEGVYVNAKGLTKVVGGKYFEEMDEFSRELMTSGAIRKNSLGGLLIQSHIAIEALENCVNMNSLIEPFIIAIKNEEEYLKEQLSLKSQSYLDVCIDDLFSGPMDVAVVEPFEDQIQIEPGIETFDMSMTSRQIAEVTNKEHRNVVRDVKTMIDRGDISPLNFEQSDYKNERGRTYQEYVLDFDATMTVITGYDAKRRKAVITRWRELEQGVAKPMCEVKRTPPTALELAKQNVMLLEELEIKDSLIARFIEARKYHTAQEIGRILTDSGIFNSQMTVMKIARELNLVIKTQLTNNIPTKEAIVKKLMCDTKPSQTAKFTQKGTQVIIDHCLAK